jgi:PAB1-binding protein PBP1
MFHISTEVTTSTAVSPKITPAQSPSLPSDMPSQSVSSARASLVVLLQKLLPLALKSNLTSLFSQKNEVAETSKEIEPVLIKQTPSYSPIYFNAIHVTPSTRLPIKHVTPTSTEIPQTFSSTQQQIRVKTTWRPWYFTAQRE